MNWIKLSEQLPPYKEDVLFYDWRLPQRYFIGRLQVGVDSEYAIKPDTHSYHYPLELEFVEYWMPFPEPPKDVE